jgi:hypothetical protein
MQLCSDLLDNAQPANPSGTFNDWTTSRLASSPSERSGFGSDFERFSPGVTLLAVML